MFYGSHLRDLNLWGMRVAATVKRCEFMDPLRNDKANPKVDERTLSIIAGALGGKLFGCYRDIKIICVG